MRLREPDNGMLVQLAITGASIAFTYYAANVIKGAMAVEQSCRDRWVEDCISSMEGTARWCAKQSISTDVCPKEAEITQLYRFVGCVAIGLMTGSLTRMSVNVLKSVSFRNEHTE